MSLNEEEMKVWYLRLTPAAKIVLAYEYHEFIAAIATGSKLSSNNVEDVLTMPGLTFGQGEKEDGERESNAARDRQQADIAFTGLFEGLKALFGWVAGGTSKWSNYGSQYMPHHG